MSLSDNGAYDEKWYPRLLANYFEPYKLLVDEIGARQRQQALFLSEEVENPLLDYPQLVSFDVTGRRQGLADLRRDIIKHESNEAVQVLYRRKISEVQAMLSLVAATLIGNDEAFTRYSDFIYGDLLPADIQYVASVFRNKVKWGLEQSGAIKVAAHKLETEIEGLPVCSSWGPQADILPSLTDGLAEEYFSQGEAVAVLTAALKKIGANDWRVVIDNSGSPFFSVSQETKSVQVPTVEQLAQRQLSRKYLLGLVAHEIETHVKRRQAGDCSKLRLLGLGLDRNLRAEEGIATYREQQVTGAHEFAGFRLYLIILAARGIIGKPKNFRQTYDFLLNYLTLSNPKQTPLSRQIQTYHQCLRVFRGTTGFTPGAIFTKDASYFGNRSIYTLLAKYPALAEYFDIGKYDPGNDTHVTLLQQLGLLPENILM